MSKDIEAGNASRATIAGWALGMIPAKLFAGFHFKRLRGDI